MKIATWNVNGIRARAEQVIGWLAAEKPDVACLQETKAGAAQIPAGLVDNTDYYSFWHGHKGYSGVGLMLRKESFLDGPPEFFHPTFDHENRIVAARTGGRVFGSVYVPNGGKDLDAKLVFLRAMKQWMLQLRSENTPLVLCGDFNVAISEIDVHPRDRGDFVGQLAVERGIMKSILAAGYVDVGRAVDPDNAALFTWWAPWRQMREKNIGWRLDLVLAPEELYGPGVACVAHRDVGTSDHGPVIARFPIK